MTMQLKVEDASFAMIRLYRVSDCAFNRVNYPKSIGLYFIHAPAYCVVEVVDIPLQ